MALDTYALTTLARFKEWVGDSSSTYNTSYEYAINAASARIERYIDREIMARDRVEFYDLLGNDTLTLRQFPINSIRFIGYGYKTAIIVSADTSQNDTMATVTVGPDGVVLNRTTSTGTIESAVTIDFATYTTSRTVDAQIELATGFNSELAETCDSKYMHKLGPIDVTDSPAYLTFPDIRATDFRVEARTGVLHVGTNFWVGTWPNTAWGNADAWRQQSVCVDYNAGYTSVPADIEQACWLIAKALFDARNANQNVQSESLRDYSYTAGGASRIQELLEENLAGWKEIR